MELIQRVKACCICVLTMKKSFKFYVSLAAVLVRFGRHILITIETTQFTTAGAVLNRGYMVLLHTEMSNLWQLWSLPVCMWTCYLIPEQEASTNQN